MGAIISEVEINSIAEELGVESGDKLLAVNGYPIRDIIDYQFQCADEYLELELEKKHGEVWILEIEKEYDEGLGISFADAVFDRVKACQNKCIFCFVDQMPPKMRASLYVKDDDYRLSFLQGNFITLTNLLEEDVQRILNMRLSPLYASIHAFDENVRVKALNNKKAGDSLKVLQLLVDGGIELHTQIVLVPQLNDGPILRHTVESLAAMHPQILSLAVVPVGLTKYRDSLEPLKMFDKLEARQVIDYVQRAQKVFLEKLGTRFVFASDELYHLAEAELPSYEEYEGFNQLENGVGLTRLLWYEISQSIKEYRQELIDIGSNNQVKFLAVTGVSGAKALEPIAKMLQSQFKIELEPVVIKNNWFGETVSVTGLLTARDIIETLSQRDLVGKIILLPDVLFRKGEDIFLDDITLEDFRARVPAPILVVKTSGAGLVAGIIKSKGE